MEGTCFESDWAALTTGLSGLRGLLGRLHQAGWTGWGRCSPSWTS